MYTSKHDDEDYRKFAKIVNADLDRRRPELTLIAPGRNRPLTICPDRVVTQEFSSRPLSSSIQPESYCSTGARTRFFRNYGQHCWSILARTTKAIPPRRNNPARFFSCHISQIEDHQPETTCM